MMEEIVKELRRMVPFKDTTVEGDLVLIAIEEPKSVVYAIITDISRDESKKSEWWLVTMQILSVPPQQVTWTLREPQFTGAEIFTMGDEGRFIQAVNLPSSGPVGTVPPKPAKKSLKSITKKEKISPLRRIK